MSYRVEYDSNVKLRKKEQWGIRRAIATGICFAVFVLMVHLFWDEGNELLFKLLIPGDTVTTWSSVQQLTEQLRSGVPIQFAVKEFCSEILQGSY